VLSLSPQPLMRALERPSNDGLSAREAVVNTMESTEYEEELGPRSIARAWRVVTEEKNAAEAFTQLALRAVNRA
jgi:hypothetical protein